MRKMSSTQPYQDVDERSPLLAASYTPDAALYREVNEPESSGEVHVMLPKDRFHFVYLSFYFLGLGTLLPWNFFITANKYWMYKFQGNSTTSNDTVDDLLNNTTIVPTQAPVQYTKLQTLFQSTLSICAMLPNVVFQFLNTVLQQRIREKVRILGSLFFMVLMFIITEIFVKIDTSGWQEVFFFMTMVCVIILNCCSAVFQSSIFGISAALPPRFTAAVMAGQGMGGVFASVAMIGALAYSTNPTSSAFAYFMTAIIVLVLTGVCYTLLRSNKFFMHYRLTRKPSILDEKARNDGHISHREDEKMLNEHRNHSINENEGTQMMVDSAHDDKDFNPLSVDSVRIVEQKAVPPLWVIFKQIWIYNFLIVFTFFVTLACFPAITASVESMLHGHGYAWNDTYFTPVCCFLLFNTMDWLGRSLAGYVHIPGKSNLVGLVVCVLARGGFLALFALCNAQPRTLPVIFAHDAYFITFMVLFGISNGHLSTLIMQYGPQKVANPDHASTAGSMLAFAISVGLFAGAGFSFVMKAVI